MRAAAEPTEEGDVAEGEAAASRPSSAVPSITEDVPGDVEQMEVEHQQPASPEEHAEFLLPPEIAAPPDQPCPPEIQVIAKTAIFDLAQLFTQRRRKSSQCRLIFLHLVRLM